ncbi:MAG: CocE/NonD family hydrolase [Acidimicrobiia bacterium]
MHNRRVTALALTLASAVVAACSPGDGTTAPTTNAATVETTTATTVPATTTTVGAEPADFSLRPSVEQLYVLDAEPGTALDLLDAAGAIVASAVADQDGAHLFRAIPAGEYSVMSADAEPPQQTDQVEVMALGDVPDQSLYDDQTIEPGFGYIETRDGTTLSANVTLPGPVEGGPYPTVVEYSGYSPSNPDDTTFAQLYTTLGYAYVGVNIRGSGCSGGSYGFFEPIQGLDGYDVIETIAAQPWVEHGTVGMVGISYPGISQLFVARTQPPHLAAITPLSVLDDSYRGTLYPGGILNTGFAVAWTEERQRESEPFGQAWSQDQADSGDEVCRDNQELRGQNQDLIGMIRDNAFYDPAIGDAIAPATFVDDIEVPVFLAGAWQDEQTGGHFPAMIDEFTSSPHVYATMVNGTHTESLSLAIFPRYVEFLDLYVARRTPSLALASAVAPLLSGSVTGIDGLSMPTDDRFEGLSYDDALALFESDPPIRILFEEGAAAGQPVGAPLPRFEASFDAWPIPGARAEPWYLGPGGVLGDEPDDTPAVAQPATSYIADPDAVPDTFYEGSSSGVWAAAPTYDWEPNPARTAASWISAPLDADTVVIGPGSVDLWVNATAEDTDIEVTLSEVRPDDNEVYVQSGWLRASQRALAPDATELQPVHTHTEADAEPLPTDEYSAVRVELFPVAHAFRAGSRVRITVDAPGGNRPVWAFETIADGETVGIAHDAEHRSRLVLSVVDGVTVPAEVPACGSLRGQPCRPYTGS